LPAKSMLGTPPSICPKVFPKSKEGKKKRGEHIPPRGLGGKGGPDSGPPRGGRGVFWLQFFGAVAKTGPQKKNNLGGSVASAPPQTPRGNGPPPGGTQAFRTWGGRGVGGGGCPKTPGRIVWGGRRAGLFGFHGGHPRPPNGGGNGIFQIVFPGGGKIPGGPFFPFVEEGGGEGGGKFRSPGAPPAVGGPKWACVAYAPRGLAPERGFPLCVGGTPGEKKTGWPPTPTPHTGFGPPAPHLG